MRESGNSTDEEDDDDDISLYLTHLKRASTAMKNCWKLLLRLMEVLSSTATFPKVCRPQQEMQLRLKEKMDVTLQFKNMRKPDEQRNTVLRL